MNIIKKIVLAILLVNIFVIAIYLNNFESRAITLTEMTEQANSFITTGQGKSEEAKFDTKNITKEFVGLGRILTMIGAGVMVAVTSIMGIKYITSPPDKQAVLKQQLIGLVVAGIVIFGAYGIWSAIVKIVSKF